jgi:hypothetical protein
MTLKKPRGFLDIESSLCENESIVGYGGHLHIVAKKIKS